MDTLQLMILSATFGIIIGIFLGALAADQHNKKRLSSGLIEISHQFKISDVEIATQKYPAIAYNKLYWQSLKEILSKTEKMIVTTAKHSEKEQSKIYTSTLIVLRNRELLNQ